mmetsp:Transcript_132408/g.247585  ORF Transcript_132408/g.247585 Transcript_132408/m.247585 type:complete len:458 (+) Transcript_132408:41-1414(+)
MEPSQSTEDLDVGEGPCTRAPVKSVSFSATRDLMNFFGPASSWRSRTATDSSVQNGAPSPKGVRGSPSKMADLQVQAMDLSRQSRQRSQSDVGTLAPWFEGSNVQASLQRVQNGFNAGDIAAGDIGPYNPPTKLIGGSATELSREETCLREDSCLTNELSSLPKLLQVVDERIEAFGGKLLKDVEDRLSSWEETTRQRLSEPSEFSIAMSEQLSAMGGQLVAMSERISKISNRPSAQLNALEERVISTDRSLSELRCEYLEGCLRSHQMEELLIALHSNIRDIRTSQVEPKQQMTVPGSQGHGHSRPDSRIIQTGPATVTGHDRGGWAPKKMSPRASASPHGSIRGATPPRLETISEGDANIMDHNSDAPGSQGAAGGEKYQELIHKGPSGNEQKAEGQPVDSDDHVAPKAAEPEAKLGAEVVIETKDVAMTVPIEALNDIADIAEPPKNADASAGN